MGVDAFINNPEYYCFYKDDEGFGDESKCSSNALKTSPKYSLFFKNAPEGSFNQQQFHWWHSSDVSKNNNKDNIGVRMRIEKYCFWECFLLLIPGPYPGPNRSLDLTPQNRRVQVLDFKRRRFTCLYQHGTILEKEFEACSHI